MSEKSTIIDAPAPPAAKTQNMKNPPALKVFDIHKVKVKRMRAVYDFDSKEEWALKLKRGDIIEVVEQQEPDDPASQSAWWEGKNGDKTGLFPTNYCEVIELQPVKKIKIKTDTVSPGIKQLQTLCFPEEGRPRSNSAPEESTLPVHEEKPIVVETTTSSSEQKSPVLSNTEKPIKSATLRESRTTTKRSQKVQELSDELQRIQQLLDKETEEKKKFEDKYRIYKQKYLDSKKKRAKEQKEREEAEKAAIEKAANEKASNEKSSNEKPSEKLVKSESESQEQKKLEKLLKKESKKRLKVETQKNELENRMKELEEQLKQLKEAQASLPTPTLIETPTVGATPDEVRVMKAQLEIKDVEIENLKKQIKIYDEREQAQKAQQEQQKLAELEKLAQKDHGTPSRNSSNMEALLAELEKEDSNSSIDGVERKERTYVRESLILRPDELKRKVASAKQVFLQPKEAPKPPPLPPISGKKTKDLIKAFEMKAAVQKLAEKNSVIRKSTKYTTDNLQHIPGIRVRSSSLADQNTPSPTSHAPISLAVEKEIKADQ